MPPPDCSVDAIFTDVEIEWRSSISLILTILRGVQICFIPRQSKVSWPLFDDMFVLGLCVLADTGGVGIYHSEEVRGAGTKSSSSHSEPGVSGCTGLDISICDCHNRLTGRNDQLGRDLRAGLLRFSDRSQDILRGLAASLLGRLICGAAGDGRVFCSSDLQLHSSCLELQAGGL